MAVGQLAPSEVSSCRCETWFKSGARSASPLPTRLACRLRPTVDDGRTPRSLFGRCTISNQTPSSELAPNTPRAPRHPFGLDCAGTVPHCPSYPAAHITADSLITETMAPPGNRPRYSGRPTGSRHDPRDDASRKIELHGTMLCCKKVSIKFEFEYLPSDPLQNVVSGLNYLSTSASRDALAKMGNEAMWKVTRILNIDFAICRLACSRLSGPRAV